MPITTLILFNTAVFLVFLQFQEKGLQENLLLGDYDVCLSNVDEVHQMTGDKRRKMLPGNNISGKVKGLYIVCKVSALLYF